MGPVIAIFLWALTLRLVYLRQIATNPFFDQPPGARALEGPFYRWFLDIVASTGGPGYFLPRLYQAIAGSLVCVLVFLIARRAFGDAAGILAGAIAGAYGTLIYFDGELQPIVFANLFTLTFVWIALAAAGSRPRLWLPAGMGLALAVMTIGRTTGRTWSIEALGGPGWLAFWNAYEVGEPQSIYFFKRYTPLLQMVLPGFGLIAPLAVAGLLFLTRNRGRALLAIAVVLHAAIIVAAHGEGFAITDAERIPVVPLLIVWAGGFVAWWMGAVRRSPRIALTALLLVGGLAVLVNHEFVPLPRPDFAAAHAGVAEAHLQKGRLEAAERELRECLTANPSFPGAHRRLGAVLARQGRLLDAAEEYRLELAMSGPDPETSASLASLLQATGRYEEAAELYRRSLALRRDQVPVLYGLAKCQIELGDLSGADVTLRELLRLEPDNVPALDNLGVVAARQGRYDLAIATWQRVLTIDPRFERAREHIESARRSGR